MKSNGRGPKVHRAASSTGSGRLGLQGDNKLCCRWHCCGVAGQPKGLFHRQKQREDSARAQGSRWGLKARGRWEQGSREDDSLA